ncbi:50S ribosomal protein L13e [Aeropyrum pernix K1]|uniref:50S ribosomal protein L13e n=1 Tax=Aeropyrum pernix TaxID=56636 RepID=UPI000005DBB0|nr:50S ribosomal protein L13e [Aeropyrum pernix]BAA79507.1 50S ribosomal protein L13e [Aeropyrum pernix K1]
MAKPKVSLPEDVEPPKAIVKKPRLVKLGPVDPGVRRGRGFSLGELAEAGLDAKKARKLGLHVDTRRRTVHPWNVEALKKYIERLREAGVEV